MENSTATPSASVELGKVNKSTEKKLAYQKEYYQKYKEKYQTVNRDNYREKIKDAPPKEKVIKEKPVKQPKTNYKIPKGNSPEEYRANKLKYYSEYYNKVEKEKRNEVFKYIKENFKDTIKEKRKEINKEINQKRKEGNKELYDIKKDALKLQRKQLKQSTTINTTDSEPNIPKTKTNLVIKKKALTTDSEPNIPKTKIKLVIKQKTLTNS